MRLIDTSTCEVLELEPGWTTSYAILSHTWGDDEYLFGDRNNPDRRESAGFNKIAGCCALAARQGYKYLWVDTCCIDKTSSAELTESINSMYRWYQDSRICYVYLADFVLEKAQQENGFTFRKCRTFRESRWFRRGWTLQELLAPKHVVFYDAEWMEIGSKNLLQTHLTNICRISTRHLFNPKEASVAAKMSWASGRQTTRVEDVAYSLLGLFEINMPLIYGEGQNAFFRLQREIIQSSSDESIFAWTERGFDYSGLLASSPQCFRDSSDIVPIRLKTLDRPPYSMTNQGLSIDLSPIYLGRKRDGGNLFGPTLRRNRDSRLKESDTIDGRQFKSVFACARGSEKEAPAILNFVIINGKLASRVDCENIDFDRSQATDMDKRHTIKSTFSRENTRQTYFVGQQRFNINVERILYDAIARVTLTSAFRRCFVLDEDASKSFQCVVDGSIFVHRFKYSEDVRLHFASSQEYYFSMSWQKPPYLVGETCWHFHFRGFRESERESASRNMRSYTIAVNSDTTLRLGDNLIKPIDDKLLLSISATEVGTHHDYVVWLDVVSVDHLKALE
ncbi:MAG: hypothetical protein LQ339_007310 [Xanthoria mediterranea]|nr:MAG: hypothetical protein LQ339_007310 [Xanthoria mediterranea]